MTIQELHKSILSCQRCSLLAETRNNIVIFRGNVKAKIMLIGEAPGANEDLQGKPFVGLSGRTLNKILSTIPVDINTDIYITNIIKCRPPDNRNPNNREIENCQEYLKKQIEIINPELIITLGKVAGNWFKDECCKDNRASLDMNLWLPGYAWLPVYHPRYLFQNKEQRYLAYKAIKNTLKKLELI